MRVKFATLVGEASPLCFFGTQSVPLCFFDTRSVPDLPNFGRGKEAKRGRFAYRNGKLDVFQPPPSASIRATEAVIRLI
jgi:hypothetical protein